MNSKTEYVLDSTAVLAVIYSEPGRERVEDALYSSVVSAINAAEIVNKLVGRGASVDAARESFRKLELTVVDWSEEMAYESAEFTRFTKSHGLSLGDRACLTLAKRLHATAVTADRTWRRSPSLGVPIMIFR